MHTPSEMLRTYYTLTANYGYGITVYYIYRNDFKAEEVHEWQVYKYVHRGIILPHHTYNQHSVCTNPGITSSSDLKWTMKTTFPQSLYSQDVCLALKG